MPSLLVTVGMSPYPFDRLIAAIEGLERDYDVFAQIGTATVRPSCPHARFLAYPELRARLERADVVVTHAGNTVRLAQRAGKVPVVIAREARHGEMANDHQVHYLRGEQRRGRVIAVWDVADLPTAVRRHAGAEGRSAHADLAAPISGQELAERLDGLCAALLGNPFGDHPLRRYAYAWEQLAGRKGRHLDLGCDDGGFAGTLLSRTSLRCEAVDARAEAVAEARRRWPHLSVHHVPSGSRLPFSDGAFDSASLLDVLEHVADEQFVLRELHRVLKPGALLVLTVPAQHAFSVLDPDNAKLRWPKLHRALYSARFGTEPYRRRFVDLSDGFRGDLAVERTCHTNYRPDALIATLRAAGFRLVGRAGANLFWRLLHGPALLAPAALRRALESAILVDGRLFRHANLFLTLERT